MNPISTLSCLLVTISISFTLSAQTSYVNHGTNTNYNLGYGDSLYISSGTYTGEIEAFQVGAKITVAPGATFQPVEFLNARGNLTIHGTAKLNTYFTTNTGFTLINYGMVTVREQLTLIGSSNTWINNYGATIKFEDKLTLNNNASMLNKGFFITEDNLTLTSSASLTNRNSLTINGNFSMSSNSTFINEGKLQTSGSLSLSGTGTITNSCRLIAEGGIVNTTNLINNGLLWAPSADGSSTITNWGTITNGANARIKCVNFVNWGTVKGSGHLYFTGLTFTAGTIGVSGTTSDTIKVYDMNRLNPSTIFDIQIGVVRPNTVFRILPAPDTIGSYISCASEYIMIPLPVKWHSFFVNLSDNTPVLNWEAEHDPGTVFQIERSYNGTDFTSIAIVMSAENNMTNYRHEDRQVNTQAPVVYYRIRATEPSGNSKLTETRIVKFSNTPGISFLTVPNPFTSQFSINYQSTTRETLTIKVYSISGQLQVNKTTMVSNGYNSIAITEAASLAKGIYMIQVNNGSKLIASQKIIKQ